MTVTVHGNTFPDLRTAWLDPGTPRAAEAVEFIVSGDAAPNIAFGDLRIDAISPIGVLIRAADGEEADSSGNGATMEIHPQTETGIMIIRNMVVTDADTVGSAFNSAFGDGTLLENCYFPADPTTAIFRFNGSRRARIVNCIAGPGVFFIGLFNNETSGLDRVTCVDTGSNSSFINAFTENCLAIGNITNANYTGATPNSDNNASEDATAPGTTFFHNVATSELVDYAGGDWNVDQAGTLGLAGVGAFIPVPVDPPDPPDPDPDPSDEPTLAVSPGEKQTLTAAGPSLAVGLGATLGGSAVTLSAKGAGGSIAWEFNDTPVADDPGWRPLKFEDGSPVVFTTQDVVVAPLSGGYVRAVLTGAGPYEVRAYQ